MTSDWSSRILDFTIQTKDLGYVVVICFILTRSAVSSLVKVARIVVFTTYDRCK